MRTQGTETDARSERSPEERCDFRSYAWGAGLALVFTMIAFALVRWGGAARTTLLVFIGMIALAQMIVHFRFFLHITFSQKREDLQLILFTTLLLIIMVGGSIWIMGSLGVRMMDR